MTGPVSWSNTDDCERCRALMEGAEPLHKETVSEGGFLVAVPGVVEHLLGGPGAARAVLGDPDGSPFAMNVGSSDAFARLRVSDPVTLFDVTHQYDKQPLLIEEVLTGTGAATHNANGARVDMEVSAENDEVIRQTREYVRYQPGKSQLMMITFDMGTADANTRSRAGLFDANDGVYCQRQGTAVTVALRTSTSGSMAQTQVAQASWNIDTFDGTGPSGKTLDMSKAQIFFADLEWLGVGTVRTGFVIDGTFCPAHYFHHANIGAGVYMKTASLPVRWETTATGVPGAARTMKSICATVISEGGFEDSRGIPATAGNGATPISVTTRRPILSIRPAATFNTIVNRSTFILDAIEVTAATQSVYWELVYDGALTNASFGTAGTTTAMEYDVAATAIADGVIIQSGYAVSGSGVSREAVRAGIASKLPLTLGIDGTGPKKLSVVCTSLSTAASVAASLNWRNLR